MTRQNTCSSPPLTLQEQALAVIRNFATSAENRAAMREAGVLQQLVAVLRRHADKSGVVSVCCSAIRNLTYGVAENKNVLAELFACKLVLAAYQVASSGLRVLAIVLVHTYCKCL